MPATIIPYASQTSAANKAALQAAGWRFMISPDTIRKNIYDPSTPHAIDNGAWGAHVRGQPWDEDAFLKLVDALGQTSDFVALPDVVEQRDATLEIADRWIERLRGLVLYVVLQDGMSEPDIAPFLPRVDGLFLGGSTEWKLETMGAWGAFAHRHGKRLHVGRVNSRKRILACRDAGAHSFDGSGVSRFARVKLPIFDAEIQQRWLLPSPEPPEKT